MDQEQAGNTPKKPALVEQLVKNAARLKMKSRTAISSRLQQRLEELRSPLAGGTTLHLGGLTSGFTRRLIHHNRSIFTSTRIFNPDLGSISPDIFPGFSSRIVKQFEGIRHLPAPAKPASGRSPDWNQQIDMTLPGGSQPPSLPGMISSPSSTIEKIKGPNIFSLDKPQAPSGMFPSRFTGVEPENPLMRPPHMAPAPSAPREAQAKKAEERKRIYRRIEYVGAPGVTVEAPNVPPPPEKSGRQPEKPEPHKVEPPQVQPPARKSPPAASFPEEEDLPLPPLLPLEKREPLEVINPVRPRPQVGHLSGIRRKPTAAEPLPAENSHLPPEPELEMPLAQEKPAEPGLDVEGKKGIPTQPQKPLEARPPAAKPIPVVKAGLEPVRRVSPVAGLPPVEPLKSILPRSQEKAQPAVSKKQDSAGPTTPASPATGVVQRLPEPAQVPAVSPVLLEPEKTPGPLEIVPLPEAHFDQTVDLPLVEKPGPAEGEQIIPPPKLKIGRSLSDSSQTASQIKTAGSEKPAAVQQPAIKPGETAHPEPSVVQRLPAEAQAETPAAATEPVIPESGKPDVLEMPLAVANKEQLSEPTPSAHPDAAPPPEKTTGRQEFPAAKRLPEESHREAPLPAALPLPEAGQTGRPEMPLAAPITSVQREPAASPAESAPQVKTSAVTRTGPPVPVKTTNLPSPPRPLPVQTALPTSQPVEPTPKPLEMPLAANPAAGPQVEAALPNQIPRPETVTPVSTPGQPQAAVGHMPVTSASTGGYGNQVPLEMPVAAVHPAQPATPPQPPTARAATPVPPAVDRHSPSPKTDTRPPASRVENLRKPAEMPLRSPLKPVITPTHAGVIQREVQEPIENQPEQQAAATAEQPPPPQPNLALLARQIYPILKQMLAIEQERQTGRR